MTFSFFFQSRCCPLRVSLAFPGTETSALIAPARKKTEIGKKQDRFKTGSRTWLGIQSVVLHGRLQLLYIDRVRLNHQTLKTL